MYYLYLGIPERYMSTLVWSHNEFLASILACVTLGSIILMVMVSALIAGVRSGGVRICLITFVHVWAILDPTSNAIHLKV